MFSANGTNNKLIEERVKKGQSCIINAMYLCQEVTMGVYSIQTLLLLYGNLFLQVTLNDSQAWSKLTVPDISSLQTVQLKYLKRIFHVPVSTPTAVVFLETGCLPIEYEINRRRLNFLHHILTLEDGDPVKVVYAEQLKLEQEPNWANDVKAVRKSYRITQIDSEIAGMSQESWKRTVKKEVIRCALDKLNKDLTQLKAGSHLGPYKELQQQNYMHHLLPEEVRAVFQARAGVIDFKEIRKYWYDDALCRLCGDEDENIDHVVNRCSKIDRTHEINNLYSADIAVAKQIAIRCLEFTAKLDDES